MTAETNLVSPFAADNTYKTRAGELAFIYCTNAPGPWPIHGRLGNSIACWAANGSYWGNSSVNGATGRDLVRPALPPIRIQWWCNVYPSTAYTYSTEEAARYNATAGALRIAVPCEMHEIVETVPAAAASVLSTTQRRKPPMPDLILRPSSLIKDKPWALQLRYHEALGETEYVTLASVTEACAREISSAGAAFWLFGEPKETPDAA